MHPPRALHIVLSLVAIAGFFLFITACMPSWNSDGSQIVFDYRNPATKEIGVALYDVGRGKTTSLYTYLPKSENDSYISAQWRDGGRTLLIFVYDAGLPSEQRTFMAEVATDGELVRTIKLKGDIYFAPVADVRGSLYLWGDHPIQVNLSTGEWKDIDDLANVYFFRGSDEVLFIAGISDEEPDLFVIGGVSPDSLKAIEPKEFHISNSSESNFQGIVPPPATDPSGRIAFPIVRKDNTTLIAICDQHGLLRSFELNLDPNSRVGNLQWSPDGMSLYAGVLGTVKKDTSVWSIAEINAESGEITRITPISQMDISKNDIDDDFFYHFPLSLSPDGRTIATNLAGAPVDNISESDRVLFLIDLGSDKPKVTKIPYPAAATK